MKKKTVWSLFKKFVNSMEIGTLISRKGIVKYIGQNELYCFGVNGGMQNLHLQNNKAKFYSIHTIDSVRNMSEKVGYLRKTDILGVYKILNHFPPEYTVSQLRKDYENGINCND